MPLENVANASPGRARDEELSEWLESLDSVAAFEGLERVDEILDAVVASARRKGAGFVRRMSRAASSTRRGLRRY